jgi:hypothetical protein
MQPNDFSTSLNYNGRPSRKPRWFKLFIIIAVAVVLVIIAASLTNASQLRVTSITPDLTNIGTITPDITLTFSKDITSDGFNVTSEPSFIHSVNADGNKLVIALEPSLKVNNDYAFTVVKVTAADGSTLENKTYKFTAKDTSFQSLSKDQQQTLLDQQTVKPKSVDFSSSYFGEADLYTNGLTQEQVGDVKQALYNYFTAAKITAPTVTFSNVVPAAPHPDDPLGPDVRSMTIAFNGKSYGAKVASTSIAGARLYLYDATGKLAYDSGDLTPQNTPTCTSGGCERAQ